MIILPFHVITSKKKESTQLQVSVDTYSIHARNPRTEELWAQESQYARNKYDWMY